MTLLPLNLQQHVCKWLCINAKQAENENEPVAMRQTSVSQAAKDKVRGKTHQQEQYRSACVQRTSCGCSRGQSARMHRSVSKVSTTIITPIDNVCTSDMVLKGDSISSQQISMHRITKQLPTKGLLEGPQRQVGISWAEVRTANVQRTST